MILIDDMLLIRVMAFEPLPFASDEGLATASSYWFRALRPVLRVTGYGRHSSYAAGLQREEREGLVARLLDLPRNGVVVTDTVRLVPQMARLAADLGVNHLAAEAAAAAHLLGASIRVGAGNLGDPLRRAAAAVGVDVAEV